MRPTKIYQNSMGCTDWVMCSNCEEVMLLPAGAERCPECGAEGCLQWVDENKQTVEDTTWIADKEYVKKTLKPQEYLSVDTLQHEYPQLYKELMGYSMGCTDFSQAINYIKLLEYSELRSAIKAHGGSYEFGSYIDSHGDTVEQELPVISVNGDTFYTCGAFDATIKEVRINDNGCLRFDAEDKDGNKVAISWSDVFAGQLTYLTREIQQTDNVHTVCENDTVLIKTKNGKTKITLNGVEEC